MPPAGIPRPVQRGKNPNSLNRDWIELEKGVMICPGNYSQAHQAFKGHNEQDASVCVVASVLSQQKKANTWTSETLDIILKLGTTLHLKTRQQSENKCQVHVEPHHVYKYFFVNNLRISLRVGTDVTTSKVPRDINIVEHISDLLKAFFTRTEAGIFAYNRIYYAIFKDDKYFFIFDPRDNDKNGKKWKGKPGFGFCYCIRSLDTTTLAQIILENIPLKQIYKFVIYPVKLENMVKVNITPPKTIEEVTKPAPAKLEPPKPAVKQPSATKLPAPVRIPSEQVVLSRVPPTRPRLQSVTNFVEIEHNKFGILRASTHQCDPRFTRYNGAQYLSNAVAALIMLRQHKAKSWIRATLDEVLKLGEVIHAASKDLGPYRITPKVTLNEKDYSPKLEKYGSIGRLQSDVDKILSLQEALTNFLIDNDCCILIGPVVLAVWKEDNRFYMFDPNERDNQGRLARNMAGFACVTWFIRIPDLVNLYMNNVPRQRQKDQFLLSKVIIKDFVPMAEDWHNFKALTSNKWILRGNFSQKDRRFPPESRNAQCTANATMALTYKELKPEQEWDSTVVDQVLMDGDEFYQGCVNYLKDNDKFKDKYLMVDELKRSFDVENKRVNLEIDDCLVNGVLNAKSDTGILNLRKGFEEFFSGSDAGIVTANLQSMAVWRKDETYYYYDSHSRDAKGVVCGYGTACVLRLVTIDDLTKALLSNMGADKQNFYNISRISVQLIDMTDDGVIKPPLNNYEEVSELVSILRANFSQNDKKFFINAGKQSVPMCMTALTINMLIPSLGWTKEDLDEVLETGNKLYDLSMDENYNGNIPEELNVDDISSNNVFKQLVIGSNSFEVEFELNGQGNIEENFEEAINTYYQSTLEIVEDGKKEFQLLLESEYMIAAIWKDENLFYLFDPKPRDEKGQVYGKEDWEGPAPPGPDIEDEPGEEHDENKEDDDDEDKAEKKSEDETDEMAGGDSFATSVSEEEQQKNEVKYESPEDSLELDELGDNTSDIVAALIDKKGSDFWKAKEIEEGKSCALRFCRIEDLIQHVIENTPYNRRRELEFTLKTVKIETKPILHEIYNPEQEKEEEFVGDWNAFKEIDYGKWILRSTRSLNDAPFPECNRGKQQLPMCMVALAFVYLYEISLFDTVILDRILAYGDRLHTIARRLRFKEWKNKKELGLTDEEIEMILESAYFDINSYPKKMCMGENLASWEVNPETILGDITSKIDEVYNLKSGLEIFFTDHNFGILECRDYNVALWKNLGMYFMFDPHPTGPSGVKSPMGVACITRYNKIEDLVETYKKCLASFGDNFFQVNIFTFVSKECDARKRQPMPEEEKTPKLGGFTQVTAGKHILRGTDTLNCTQFSRGVHIESAAIAFAALAISQAVEADTWTRILINEVLAVGHHLYTETLQKLGDKFNPWEDRLDIYRVNTDFHVGELRANFVLRYTEQRGVVDIKNAKVPNLRQGLERFFNGDLYGIVIADKFVWAVWEETSGKETNIYVFDPNSRGATGLPTQGGLACLMKFCNAKETADHLMACMVGMNKSKTPFAIVPVDVVLEDTKTKKKTPVKTKKLPCECYLTPPLNVMTKPEKPMSCKEAALQAKRQMRAIAEQERKKEEQRKMTLLGRKQFHQVSPGVYIIRGLRTMVKDRDLPVNIAAFVYMKVAPDLFKWTYKEIDIILETGYQLHIDSYNAYKPPSEKLNLQQVLRRVIVKDQEVRIDIKKPSTGLPFTKNYILYGLEQIFVALNFCILNVLEYLVSIYFKSGYYFLFDPYMRDLNGNKTEKGGSAVMMRFDNLSDLVDKLVNNFADSEETDRPMFVLIYMAIADVLPLTEMPMSQQM